MEVLAYEQILLRSSRQQQSRRGPVDQDPRRPGCAVYRDWISRCVGLRSRSSGSGSRHRTRHRQGKPSAIMDALREIEGTPLGPFGDWIILENGEKKWTSRPTSEQELLEWTPDLKNPSTLDHLYVTRFGDLDIVPEVGVGGTYVALRDRACQRSFDGFDVWIAHIDEILAHSTVPRRKKDIPRVAALRKIQRRFGQMAGCGSA